jgi:hypothetical protein
MPGSFELENHPSAQAPNPAQEGALADRTVTVGIGRKIGILYAIGNLTRITQLKRIEKLSLLEARKSQQRKR